MTDQKRSVIAHARLRIFWRRSEYVQSVLNRAWDYPDGFKSVDDVSRAVHSLVENRRLVFLDLLRSQSGAQQAVLRAVAADGVVTAPTGKDFLGRHSLGAASTVASVIEALVDKELLYRTEDGYIVYDRLFGEWLASRARIPNG